jgi:hypothetical protein
MRNLLKCWIKERLAAHEGGAGSIAIGWDDATRGYVISQCAMYTHIDEILGWSSRLERAITLAITGQKYDD